MVRVIDLSRQQRTRELMRKAAERREALREEENKKIMEKYLGVASRVLSKMGFADYSIDGTRYKLVVSTPCTEEDFPHESFKNSDWIGKVFFNRLEIQTSQRTVEYSSRSRLKQISNLAHALANEYERDSSIFPFLRKEWFVRQKDLSLPSPEEMNRDLLWVVGNSPYR